MARTGTFRGGVPIGQTLYGAWTGEVYKVNNSGVATLFSTLAGTDYPSFGRNNKTIPDIAVVTGDGAFIINTTAGAVQAYPDADVTTPGTPSCCCGYMGYIFFGYTNGVLQVTKYNSTSISTLDQAAAITNHDGIKAIFGWQGQIYSLGEHTVEIWGEPINATGFPLTRVGFNITPGIIGKRAFAGWEDEWGYPPIYVGSDGTVRQLQGYQAAKISNTDLERALREVAFTDYDSINCLVYNVGGNAFWQVNLPNQSWVYHVNEGTWHQRKSQGSAKCKLVNSVPFNEKWVVGDTDSNAVYSMTFDTNYEGSEEISAQLESGPMKQFPHRQRIVRADFDFTVGVGVTTGSDPEQTDPQVQIEVSYDGGHSWPHSWNRKLGKEGKYFKRVYVLNPGLTGDEGARWRWTISDPIHVGFQGADMAVGLLSK
jgi:hypothetical protein